MTSLFVVLLLVVVAGWSPLVTGSVLVNLNCDNLIEQVQSASREDVRPLEDNTGSVLMKLYDDCIRIIAEGRGVVREPLGITRKGSPEDNVNVHKYSVVLNGENLEFRDGDNLVRKRKKFTARKPIMV